MQVKMSITMIFLKTITSLASTNLYMIKIEKEENLAGGILPVRRGAESHGKRILAVVTRNRIPLLSAVLLLVSIASCSRGEAYFKFQPIQKGKWHQDSVITFRMDSVSFIPGEKYDITIELTTNSMYPYHDLWLQVEENLGDTVFQIDTMHYTLADEHGRWLGSGIGVGYQFSFPYRGGVLLDSASLYELRLRQLMGTTSLTGVDRAGVKVMPSSIALR